MLLTIQILVTIATLSFTAVAAAADLNRTHATNPLWGGHPRLHVVWQVFTHIGVGIVALVVLWAPVAGLGLRLAISMALSAVVLTSFFIAALSMSIYGGEIADTNGYTPFRFSIGRAHWTVDKNILLFASAAVVLAAAFVLTLVSEGFRS